MLNGLEKSLERKIPECKRRWEVNEEADIYASNTITSHQGWPDIDFFPEHRNLTPENS